MIRINELWVFKHHFQHYLSYIVAVLLEEKTEVSREYHQPATNH